MTQILPGEIPDPVGHYPPSAYTPPLVSAQAPRNLWWVWLLFPAVSGLLVGILWWFLAPGGAFYGKGADYNLWLPRDMVLGALGVVAAVVSVCLLLARGRRTGGASRAALVALVVGSAVGSVLAWRTGVFMGSLFQTPPAQLPSPSVLFSLRAQVVLFLWPLTVAVVAFVVSFAGQLFFQREAQPAARSGDPV